MIKLALLTSILVAQFLTLSTPRADDPQPGGGQGPELALMRTDDPQPCPDCDPGGGQGPELA